VQACQKTCYQRHVIKRCGCFDAYFPADNASAFNYVSVPVCSVKNITQGVLLWSLQLLNRVIVVQPQCFTMFTCNVIRMLVSFPRPLTLWVIIPSLKRLCRFVCWLLCLSTETLKREVWLSLILGYKTIVKTVILTLCIKLYVSGFASSAKIWWISKFVKLLQYYHYVSLNCLKQSAQNH